LSERSSYPHPRDQTIINICFPARAAALAAIFALAVAGCGSQADPASEAEVAAGAPVKIGYLASQTGFCAAAAREYVAGAELAVRALDARGGVDGHRLELIVRDDRATPSVGVQRAHELVGDDHVKYLAGTCSGAVGESVATAVANPGHVLYVAGVADPKAFAGGPEVYAFGTIPTTAIEGGYAAAYVRAHPRWRRVAVVSEDYSYGRQVTAAFARALASDRPAAGGGQRIVSEQFLPSGGADYAPYIKRLLAARPDAIYSTAIEDDAVRLVEQGLPLGLFAPGRGFFGVMDYRTLARMPEPPVGVEGYTYYPSASIYHTPLARELLRLGRRVADGGAAGDAFNQIELIAQGIAKARSTDPAKVRDALSGGSVALVQGEVRVRACDHVAATPIAMGTVVGPSARLPYARLEPVASIGTGGDWGC
jgi:branched-chain amino acid transport system substrate-binding protein